MGSYPRSKLSCSNSFLTTNEPSNPALEAIVYTGSCIYPNYGIYYKVLALLFHNIKLLKFTLLPRIFNNKIITIEILIIL